MTLLLLLACGQARSAEPEELPWSPHRAMLDPANPKRCVTCHADGVPEEGPLGHAGDPVLCVACHTATPHAGAALHLGPLPEAMVEGATQAGLPLTAEGEVVCMTCHDPHPPGATKRATERAGWVQDEVLPTQWREEVVEPSLQQRGEALGLTLQPVTQESTLVRLPLSDGSLCAACHSQEATSSRARRSAEGQP